MAGLSACHMLSYLALCAREGIAIRTYDDTAEGTMIIAAGGGHFSEVTLRPQVTVAEGADLQQAMALHDTAHRQCFIAASVNVYGEPTLTSASPPEV